MMLARKPCLFGITVLLIHMSGCATTTTNRIDVDNSTHELPVGPTSQDFRSISQEMSRAIITLPQIQNHVRDNTAPPRIAFDRVINNSSEYIDGELVLKMIRSELIKSAEGRLVFLDRDAIKTIEKENRDKAAGKRTTSGDQIPSGADFFLRGDIDSIDRPANKGYTRYFRFSFRLTDAGTSDIIWEHPYEMKQQTAIGIMYR